MAGVGEMMSVVSGISLRQAALVAGVGYLVVFLFGFGNLFREKLIVRGDAAATTRNIAASEWESRTRVGEGSKPLPDRL